MIRRCVDYVPPPPVPVLKPQLPSPATAAETMLMDQQGHYERILSDVHEDIRQARQKTLDIKHPLVIRNSQHMTQF